jgi:hypothetical protein
MVDPLDADAPSCPECGWHLPAALARCAGCNYPDPLPTSLSGNDWPVVGCGGWLQGVTKLPPRLPCGVDDPAHYREQHPEIALFHRALHEAWAQQIEACARLWALPFTPNRRGGKTR